MFHMHAVLYSCCVVGEELCRQLSDHGAKLVMFARSKEKMVAIKESLKNPDDAR